MQLERSAQLPLWQSPHKDLAASSAYSIYLIGITTNEDFFPDDSEARAAHPLTLFVPFLLRTVFFFASSAKWKLFSGCHAHTYVHSYIRTHTLFFLAHPPFLSPLNSKMEGAASKKTQCLLLSLYRKIRVQSIHFFVQMSIPTLAIISE